MIGSSQCLVCARLLTATPLDSEHLHTSPVERLARLDGLEVVCFKTLYTQVDPQESAETLIPSVLPLLLRTPPPQTPIPLPIEMGTVARITLKKTETARGAARRHPAARCRASAASPPGYARWARRTTTRVASSGGAWSERPPSGATFSNGPTTTRPAPRRTFSCCGR